MHHPPSAQLEIHWKMVAAIAMIAMIAAALFCGVFLLLTVWLPNYYSLERSTVENSAAIAATNGEVLQIETAIHLRPGTAERPH